MNCFMRTTLFLFFALLVWGCRIATESAQTQAPALPAAYPPGTGSPDTLNLAAGPVHALFADSLLAALLDTALKNNFDARIAWQRIEMARASLVAARGQLLPTASVAGSAAVRRFGLYTMDGAGNAATDIRPGEIVPVNLPDYAAGLQAIWEVDINGRLRNQKRAAIARVLATTEGRHWVITNLVADVAAAYIELLALDAELEVIGSMVKLQEDALNVVTIQKENAVATELAVNQFQAQVLHSRALEIHTRQMIIETENRLNFLLGRLPQPALRRASTLTQPARNDLAAGLPAQLLYNRPDIRQAELELLAARADVRAARAAFFPSLTIVGGVGQQAYRTDLLQSPQSFAFNVLGGLSAPLINRFAIQARFKGATAAQTEALLQYQKTVVNGYIEVYNELTRYNNLKLMLSQKEQEAAVLTRAVSTAGELYRTGRANYLEVLLTQQAALTARIDLVNARRQLNQSLIQIYRALGGGWRGS
jgi:NodT family efflux transporter outer membrane factor (OMF) lipoprotein